MQLPKRALKLLKLAAIPVLGAAGAFVVAIVNAHRTRLHFPEVEPLEEYGNAASKVVGNSFSLLIWNIGFTGFGSESDFFFDGGKTVIAPEKWVQKNLAGITDELRRFAPKTDFILLQEADIEAKRSHNYNHVETFAQALPNYSHTFAANFKVEFIPYPFLGPFMGKVNSGLLNLSRHRAIESIRHGFDKNYIWPKRLFYPVRCLLWQRYRLENGKELIIVNTHKSAYDKRINLKQDQMLKLRRLILHEYEQNGNYVIVGGDWNQLPPGFDERKFVKPGGEPATGHSEIKHDFMPAGWQWIYDPETATNRCLKKPFKIGYTFTSIIDFYLLSPNLKAEEVRAIDQNFAWSDHQPVYLKVSIR